MPHRVAAICLLWLGLFLSLVKENRAEDVLVVLADVMGPIYLVNITDDSSKLLYTDVPGPNAFASDVPYETIYWSNAQTNKINRVKIDGTKFSHVIGAFQCKGLVVDSKRKILFYTELHKIKKIDLTKKKLKDKDAKVVTTLDTTSTPDRITADFVKRMLYITVHGRNPRIEMFDYDGANKQSLKITAKIPSSLVLDAAGNRLFWLDRHYSNNNVMTTNLDTKITKGTSRKISSYHRPYDIDVDDNIIYIVHLEAKEYFFTIPVEAGRGNRHKCPKGMLLHRHIKAFRYPYVCPRWTYGLGCDTPCGHCKNNESCSETHGVCPNGCDQPWIGSHCDKVKEKESMPMIWIYAGGGAALLVIIGIAVGVVLFLKRRRAAAQEEEQMQLMR